VKRLDVSATPFLRAMCALGVAVMVAQLLLLAEPDFARKIVQALWDKTVHFLYFGTMAFLMWIATGKRWPFAIWLAVAFIGAADETLQAYTPGRTSDINDWLADAFGSAAALFIAQRVIKPGSIGDRPLVPHAGTSGLSPNGG
jgi:VanZ family protein